jgi:single-strand DNA-binding protein
MLNQHTIIGNLTKDAEVKQSNNGKSFCNFTVACNHWQKDAQGNQKISYFNCVCFNQTADFIGANAKKGMRVCASGEGMQDKYADKESGKERTSYKISCTSVDLLESKSNRDERPDQEYKATARPAKGEELPAMDDNIRDPFSDE